MTIYDDARAALARVFGPAVTRQTAAVTARSGLHLRGGPGTEFAIIKTVAFGNKVYLGTRQGNWTEVDLEGDGTIDGWMFASYLK